MSSSLIRFKWIFDEAGNSHRFSLDIKTLTFQKLTETVRSLAAASLREIKIGWKGNKKMLTLYFPNVVWIFHIFRRGW